MCWWRRIRLRWVNFERLKEKLTSVSLGMSSGLVEALRTIKDKDELATIRVAIEVAQRVFTIVRAGLRSKQTEWEIACEIDRLTSNSAVVARASNRLWRLARARLCPMQYPYPDDWLLAVCAHRLGANRARLPQ